MIVRRTLHGLGFRFRLCPQHLPGRPDIVLPKYRLVIFVHGCFWHQHCCPRGKVPESNRDFWTTKLSRNVERDREKREALEGAGWRVLIIWECDTKRGTLAEWLTKQIAANR